MELLEIANEEILMLKEALQAKDIRCTCVESPSEVCPIQIDVSQWKAHGKKREFDKYIEKRHKKEMRELVEEMKQRITCRLCKLAVEDVKQEVLKQL